LFLSDRPWPISIVLPVFSLITSSHLNKTDMLLSGIRWAHASHASVNTDFTTRNTSHVGQGQICLKDLDLSFIVLWNMTPFCVAVNTEFTVYYWWFFLCCPFYWALIVYLHCIILCCMASTPLWGKIVHNQ
jgi:hypothetical protein